MKKLPIICALGLIGLSWQASGQQTGNEPILLAKQTGSSVNHDTVKIKSCIVADGFTLSYKDPQNINFDPAHRINVFSYHPEIFSVSSGVVVSIFSVSGLFIVMIKHNDDYYVYSKLKSVAVKKGDILEDGDVVGELPFDIDTKVYTVEFEMAKIKNGTTQFSSPKELVGFVGKRCETHD